ncbi:MAG: beta-xylosidase [Actinomycetota bacterium]|nr:beta-xylosidase [Actinomycetota bacterium]
MYFEPADVIDTPAPFDPDDVRARELCEQMTLEEKVAQLVGFWVDEGGAVVAPLQDQMDPHVGLEKFARNGLGHLTRVYGTRPVDAAERAHWLQSTQRHLVANTRLGIPAIVHEECLTGLSAWKAATFPTPLAWGAAFNPELVERMGAAIGETMHSLGIHQGLAPVLDVVRDARWGRVEECISEDPYVVGTIGTSYVRGLQSAGVLATLKHFVGYSSSRTGRNLGPVSAGPREIADILLIPFEMAVLDGKAQSVMHSYADIDGVPVAADPRLLTELLRDRWGFTGTVVADYFGIAFLETLHGVAGSAGTAAALALTAGVDVELPTGNAYLGPLVDQVRSGKIDEALVDRATIRVLRQKIRLGLLDQSFDTAPPKHFDLDSEKHRAIAAELAEQSVILLSNDGTLPLSNSGRVAVIGPNANRAEALFGCYSFTNHVLGHHPEVPRGFEARTVLEAFRDEFGSASVVFSAGCSVDDEDRSGFAAATAAARNADHAVVVVGDQAGLFGRGTVGEGCDTDDLELPGVQRELVEAILDTGTPVTMVLVTGRPYAVSWALDRCAAVIQSFFPGEEGAQAIAGVILGRVNPSGRLPVTLPRSAGSQPHTYLQPRLGQPGAVSNLESGTLLPFGHGLSYTQFAHTNLRVLGSTSAGGSFVAAVSVQNTGSRRGVDVVQLYAHDIEASITRPTAQLVAFTRVELEPGETATVSFTVPTTRLAFSDRNLRRIVEPGRVDLWVGPSCESRETETHLEIIGTTHPVTIADGRWARVEVQPDGQSSSNARSDVRLPLEAAKRNTRER